jgi:hypothetical protein
MLIDEAPRTLLEEVNTLIDLHMMILKKHLVPCLFLITILIFLLLFIDEFIFLKFENVIFFINKILQVQLPITILGRLLRDNTYDIH